MKELNINDQYEEITDKQNWIKGQEQIFDIKRYRKK